MLSTKAASNGNLESTGNPTTATRAEIKGARKRQGIISSGNAGRISLVSVLKRKPETSTRGSGRGRFRVISKRNALRTRRGNDLAKSKRKELPRSDHGNVQRIERVRLKRRNTPRTKRRKNALEMPRSPKNTPRTVPSHGITQKRSAWIVQKRSLSAHRKESHENVPRIAVPDLGVVQRLELLLHQLHHLPQHCQLCRLRRKNRN